MTDESKPIYSHNPYRAEGFPLLVLDVKRKVCVPFNEGFRVLHWHDEIQFVLVKKGIVHAKIYEEELDIPAGSCLFINRSVLHLLTEKEDCHYHSFLIPEKMLSFFSGSLMEHSDVRTITHNPAFTHCLLSEKNPEHRRVLDQFQKLDCLYVAKGAASHWEYRVSIALVSAWLSFISLFQELPDQLPSRDYVRIRTLLSYIHTNYSQDISAQDIAASANISKSECLRCFRRFTGEAPYQYLLRYRLYRSLSLLKNTELSVTEIAEETGFSSASSYIKYFRKYYGVTPSVYRRDNAGI